MVSLRVSRSLHQRPKMAGLLPGPHTALAQANLCCKRGGLRENKNFGNEDILGSPAARSLISTGSGVFLLLGNLRSSCFLHCEIRTLHAEIREKQLLGDSGWLLT